jgi:flagellin-like protein
MNKEGLSPVIGVVLLLMITVVAAGIILAFVVPFVQNNLAGSGECFEILGDLSFDETPYNCFNSPSIEGRTGFSVRIDSENIVGFRVALQAEGSSDAFDVTDGDQYPELRMLDGDFDGPLQVPQRGGVRTYVALGVFDKIEIFPILESDRKCDLADEIDINVCDDPEASTLIGSP